MLVNGRYEIRESCPPGRLGPMLRVCEVERPDRLLALKVFTRGAPSAEERVHFVQSCRRLGMLPSPFLVPPIEAGVIETLAPAPSEDAATAAARVPAGLAPGCLFVVREFVTGQDLVTALTATVPSLWSEFFIQACLGLEALRARAEVHGRIHPANVWVRGGVGGGPGLAPAPGGRAGALQLVLVDGAVADKTLWPVPPPPAPFAAPELACGAAPDGRADLFGLAACFALAVPGAVPGAVPALPDAVPGLAPELGRILRRMLATDPAERPASARECLELFRPERASALPGTFEDLLAQPLRPRLLGRADLLCSLTEWCLDATLRAGAPLPPPSAPPPAPAPAAGPAAAAAVAAVPTPVLPAAAPAAPAPGQHLALVRGLPGSGRSRLLRELGAALWNQVRVLEVRCHAAESALGGFRALLARLGSDPGRAGPRDLQAERFPGGPAVLGRRILDALGGRPTVLLIDDLHRMDEGAVELVETLASAAAAARLAVVAAYAGDAAATPAARRLAAEVAGRRGARVYDLRPLTPEETGELLKDVLGLRDCPRPLAQRFFRDTQGSPLHLVQAVACVVEDRVLVRAGGRWQADLEDLASMPVPDRPATALQRRITRLAEPMRRVLAQLVELGGPASAAALALGTGLAPDAVRDLLVALLRRGLVVRTSLLDFACAHASLAELLSRRLTGDTEVERPVPEDTPVHDTAAIARHTPTPRIALFPGSVPGRAWRVVSDDRTTAFSAPAAPASDTRRVPARTDPRLMGEHGLLRMLDIHRALLGELDAKRLLDKIMDAVISLLGAERGFLILFEEGKLAIKVARNFDQEDVSKPEFELSRSIAEEVLKGGRPVLTANAGADERFRKHSSVDHLKLQSVLCAPLRHGDRLLGCIYLDNRMERAQFLEHDIPVMENFCTAAALALWNSRLHGELVRRQQEIEALNVRLAEQVDRQKVELVQVKETLAHKEGELAQRYAYDRILGRSRSMQHLYRTLDHLKGSTVPVLILGESGTGKELVARAIHFHSTLKDHPFVSINCAAIPESLLESELFGHVRGAFTGAERDREGLFVSAHGGTLFLDEVGDMPAAMQVKLLRAIQDGEIRPVGGREARQVKVRIVAATCRDLEALLKAGAFREDLYYRLNVVALRMPPLRERREDIPLLVEHFLATAAKGGKPLRGIEREALRRMVEYPWPGNVRELENHIYRMVALAGEGGGDLTVADLEPAVREGRGAAGSAGGPAPAVVPAPLLPPTRDTARDAVPAAAAAAAPAAPAPSALPAVPVAPAPAPAAAAPAPVRATAGAEAAAGGDPIPLEEVTRRHILSAVEHTGGNYSEAARILGISYVTLWRKLKAYGFTKKT